MLYLENTSCATQELVKCCFVFRKAFYVCSFCLILRTSTFSVKRYEIDVKGCTMNDVNEEPMIVTWELSGSAGGPMCIICHTSVLSLPMLKAIVAITVIVPGI